MVFKSIMVSLAKTKNMNPAFILLQTALPQANTHTSADELVKHDPYGIFMAIMAITLVLTILTLIYLSFKVVTKILNKKPKVAPSQGTEPAKTEAKAMPSGEVNAAIAYALHLYMQQLNSEETTELTIKRIAHRYSPWSSKIHTLQRQPGQFI